MWTHCSHVTHAYIYICAWVNYVIIGLNNGILAVECKAVTWASINKFSVWSLRRKLNEIWTKIQFSFKNMYLETSGSCCSGLNFLMIIFHQCNSLPAPHLMTNQASRVWHQAISNHNDWVIYYHKCNVKNTAPSCQHLVLTFTPGRYSTWWSPGANVGPTICWPGVSIVVPTLITPTDSGNKG